ncbi:hypothetical protein GOP47_0003709 [Adiantum capillus-veneris]|uniref:Ribosomal RNA-processing protein 7 C-terminal domain-containing protein n=1 Tax=Adiantum capillus-veneris TaxID=13818 RepID=A0A9D4V757_ADICA|nr:hypothetical protein GOP47_0003709 [Adiantum capillus-veneris]
MRYTPVETNLEYQLFLCGIELFCRCKENEAAVLAEAKDVIEIGITENDLVIGMRKWLSDYHNKRPGFHVLQQQTDNFIADFEAREEKARQERETAAAEEGWTVVAHHKGSKKTTDPESGISVGSVAAAVVERLRKKQNNGSDLNFYRFQRRKARRNAMVPKTPCSNLLPRHTVTKTARGDTVSF